MNNTLSETYQIDTVLQGIQTPLYDSLIATWNTDKLDAYGRVYKNLTEQGDYVPEVYNSVNKKYEEVYYNNQSCFFFIDDENHSTQDQHEYQTDVKIAFMVNLSDVKASTERVDSDVQRDAISAIRNLYSDFTITGIEKGIDNVFRGFKTIGIKWNDMQPLHVFAIVGELKYIVNDKCD